MLRLLPDAICVGIFPRNSWWRSGSKTPNFVATPSVLVGEMLPSILNEMLAAWKAGGGSWGTINVVVSDTLAAVVPMPWQDALRRDSEIRAYGDACLEAGGLKLDSGSLTHAEFASFGATGIAYSLRTVLLNGLVEAASGWGLRTKNIVPVSSYAFFNFKRGQASRAKILTVEEPTLLHGLIIDNGAIVGMDVEPLVGDKVAAVRRLMARYFCQPEEVGDVVRWVCSDDSSGEQDWRAVLHGRKLTTISVEKWHRR